MGRDVNEAVSNLLAQLEHQEPDNAYVEVSEYIDVSVSDLRAACVNNASHPLATVFAQAVQTHPEGKKVSIDRVDLLGLLRNREVETYRLKDGRHTKRLGAEYPTGKATDTADLPSLRDIERPDEDPQLGSTSPGE